MFLHLLVEDALLQAVFNHFGVESIPFVPSILHNLNPSSTDRLERIQRANIISIAHPNVFDLSLVL